MVAEEGCASGGAEVASWLVLVLVLEVAGWDCGTAAHACCGAAGSAGDWECTPSRLWLWGRSTLALPLAAVAPRSLLPLCTYTRPADSDPDPDSLRPVA